MRASEPRPLRRVMLAALLLALLVGCEKPPPPPPPETNAPPVEETKVFSADELLALADEIQPLVAFELDQASPAVNIGDEIDCRLLNGRVAKGPVTLIGTNGFLVKHGDTETTVSWDTVDVGTRLRTDSAYREKWIASASTVQARGSITNEGVEIPELKYGCAEEFEHALACGDPKAHCIRGANHLKGSQCSKDPAYAFLHLRVAAMQEDAKAMYLLGTMLYNGIGMEPNQSHGLRWISASATRGCAPAQQFLEQHKIDRASWIQAAQKAEQERQEYATRLEEARNDPKYETVAQSRGFKRIRKTHDPDRTTSRVRMTDDRPYNIQY